MFYVIHATYFEHTADGTISYSAPTFYIDGDIQGIVSTEAAKRIARNIVDPTGKAEVHISAFEHPFITVNRRT